MKYHRQKDYEWVQPVRKGYRMMCCDCGLVHTLDFRIVKNRVQLRAYRNNRATAAARRKFGEIRVVKTTKHKHHEHHI